MRGQRLLRDFTQNSQELKSKATSHTPSHSLPGSEKETANVVSYFLRRLIS